MQRLARELNLSETVFLGPGDGTCDGAARIFTPFAELPFAGHPVLGTAWMLAEEGGLDVVRLRTGVGVVRIEMRRERGQLVCAEMEQPLPEPVDPPDPERILGALGLGRSRLPIGAFRNGPVHTYIALESPEELAALRPDLGALAELGEYGFSCFAELPASAPAPPPAPAPAREPRSGERGASARGERLFSARVFVPGLGVPEDPATGSAAGPLAVHLLRHGVLASGETIRIQQGVQIGRPSTLWARAVGSAEALSGVFVAGRAVRVAQGEYRWA